MIFYRLYIKTFLGLLIFIFGNSIEAQLPQTKLYSVAIENSFDSIWKISKVQFLSAFNLSGYTNQPFHINEKEILCTVRRMDESNTEIFHLNMHTETLRRVTETLSHEYSPRLYAGDQNYFTAVNVPENDSTIQNLILYNLYTGKAVKPILDQHGKIGYYRFIRPKQWICFLVAENNLFALCQENPPSRKVFASGIGRTFELRNEKEILFVHKIMENTWILKSYSIMDEKIVSWITMPKGTEDFVILGDGSILCAQDSKLLKYTYKGTEWKTVTDFKSLGITNINRLSMHGKNLVMVTGK